jgi:hypothetical protein
VSFVSAVITDEANRLHSHVKGGCETVVSYRDGSLYKFRTKTVHNYTPHSTRTHYMHTHTPDLLRSKAADVTAPITGLRCTCLVAAYRA